MANWKATRRRRRIRRIAVELLAKELGLTVAALERQAWQMARAKKELGKSVVTFKLERHGIKLTKAEEMEIARVHRVLTLAMADLNRASIAIGQIDAAAGAVEGAQKSISDAVRWLARGRPSQLCFACKGPDAICVVACPICNGRGWI